MKKLKLLIVGSDERQIYCAEKLSEQYDTSFIGFDSEKLPEDFPVPPASPYERGAYDCAVLPVRCSDSKLLHTVGTLLSPEGMVIAGRLPEESGSAFGEREVISFLDREDFALKNAVLTAEGAVQTALDRLNVSLHSMPVLIIGLGRIGTALTTLLKGFGADITAAVRNERGAARAFMLGVKAIRSDSIGGGYGLIFNTVPSLMLDEMVLSEQSRDTLIIELASKPFGTDFEAVEKLGIRAVKASGLPAVTVPVSAGRLIADTVHGILEERGERNV